MSNWLPGQAQRGVVEGVTSGWCAVTGGVLEGSCAFQHPHQQPGNKTLMNTK